MNVYKNIEKFLKYFKGKKNCVYTSFHNSNTKNDLS
jgi:hypothetical protein